MNQPTPTQGFEFPTAMQEQAEKRLRATKTGPVGSVRPGVEVGMRQGTPKITAMRSSLDSHDPDDDSDVPDLPPPPRSQGPQQPGSPAVTGESGEAAGAMLGSAFMAGTGASHQVRQQIPSHITATIPNPEPGQTPMVTDDMVSMSLPSRFNFYPFKDLYIKPLRVPHLAKLSKANDVDSMFMVCEVISSILATPGGDSNIGFKLCIADFQAVLYWLRAHSFPKSTMRIKSMCQNHVHHEKVNKGLLAKETLTNETSHDVSGLESIELERAPDPAHYKFNIEINGHSGVVVLRPETMWDSIQFLSDQRYLDPEFQYVARLAASIDMDSAIPLDPIKGRPQMWTLQQKIEVVENHLSMADVMLITEFNELVDSFGVNEIVDVKCKECGHVGQVRLAIDARTFPSPTF